MGNDKRNQTKNNSWGKNTPEHKIVVYLHFEPSFHADICSFVHLLGAKDDVRTAQSVGWLQLSSWHQGIIRCNVVWNGIAPTPLPESPMASKSEDHKFASEEHSDLIRVSPSCNRKCYLHINSPSSSDFTNAGQPESLQVY